MDGARESRDSEENLRGGGGMSGTAQYPLGVTGGDTWALSVSVT